MITTVQSAVKLVIQQHEQEYKEYLENSSNAITPDLSTEEPDNSLSMGASILTLFRKQNRAKYFDCSPKIDSLLEEFTGELAPIKPIPPGIHPVKDIRLIEKFLYDDTSSDDDSYEDIDYVDASPPDSKLVSLEEVKDFHPKDGEIEYDILCEKLSKINLLIAKIEALNDNPTPSSDFVLKSPIPVKDGDSFLEKFKTTPKLETFKFDIEEKNSGSTTIHAGISLLDLEYFYFKSNPDPGELTSIVDSGIRKNVLSMTNVNLP
ncbi:hypothetical protein Tco_1415429, partial [Tanacetum coccineum]